MRWCFAYAVVACSLSLVNKHLFSVEGFRQVCALLVAQQLCTVVLIPIVFGTIKWNWATVRQVAPLTCINVVNVLVGFEALRRVDVPMFLVLRRLTTPTVMLVEWLWTGSVAPRSIRACIALSMFGSLIAGSGDLGYDSMGYGLTFLNNACTASYLLLLQQISLPPLELMYYNGAMSLPALLVLALATVDMDDLIGSLSVWFVLSSIMGVVYVTVLTKCTKEHSALATSVTGNVKDGVTTVLGFLLFAVPIRSLNVLGVMVSLVAGMCYTWLKIRGINSDRNVDSEESNQV